MFTSFPTFVPSVHLSRSTFLLPPCVSYTRHRNQLFSLPPSVKLQPNSSPSSSPQRKSRSSSFYRHYNEHVSSVQRLITRRKIIHMLGPFFPQNLGDSNLLKSEIVRQELSNLETDYMQLAKLGSQYQKFDREGKLMYIDRALDVVDRFNIFMTRLKLSEDFSSQMFIKQYQLKLQEFGLTLDSLITNTKKSLEMMRDDVPDV